MKRNEWGEPERQGTWKARIPSGLPISASGAILLLCIAVFFFSAVIPGLSGFLALRPEYLMQRPWTLITHMFVHANFDHLFWNMIVLFFFGMELERRVGERKFSANLHPIRNCGGRRPDDGGGRKPGRSQRGALRGDGLPGHNRSRDIGAALLRNTAVHTKCSCALRPDRLPEHGLGRQSPIWPI